jgi:3D (Asp-Asp-Asp) domain-containing protein
MVAAFSAFVWLHGVTTLDLPSPDLEASTRTGLRDAPIPGATLPFTATAYCKGDVTKSGTAPKNGVAAADPGLLPIGTIIQVGSGSGRANGVYTVLDTGPKIQGRLIDLYMWSCYDALSFGRRPVDVTVLRLGWDPSATTLTLAERWLRGQPPTRTPQTTAQAPLD